MSQSEILICGKCFGDFTSVRDFKIHDCFETLREKYIKLLLEVKAYRHGSI
jgi:hypothetical protein